MKKCLLVAMLLFAGQAYSMEWHSPSSENILGRWWQGESGSIYNRIPDRFKDKLRTPLWDLSTNPAGVYLKFVTDSRDIVVKYTLKSKNLNMWHMPTMGVSGVDLYMHDADGAERWCSSYSRNFSDTVSFYYKDMLYGDKAEFTLYLPLYNTVESLEIGVDDTASFTFVGEEKNPVVVYGTSIAQGACATRPGMAWSNILHRRLGIPFVNLGFSGNGRLEDAMFAALAEIPARAYIIDCMPNMTEPDRRDSVFVRLIRGVEFLRRSNDAPIVIAEHDGYMNESVVPDSRDRVAFVNEKLREAYETLVSKGYKDLYYVTKADIGMDSYSQVDGVHANDYGMMLYADAYEKVLKAILSAQ